MGNREYFNSVAGNYVNKRERRSREKFAEILKLSGIKKGMKIVEAGCGRGDFTGEFLKKAGGKGFVWGVDISEKMLSYAMKKHKGNRRIKFILSDVRKIPLKSGCAGMIMCFNSFPHFFPKEKVIKEFSRLLKDDGRLVIAHGATRNSINAFHKSLKFNMNNHSLPSAKELEYLLKKNGLETLKYIDRCCYFLLVKKRVNAG